MTTPQTPAWSELIFDLDGTLIDSAPSILAGFETILRESDIAPILPIDARLIGPPLLETLAVLTGSSNESLLKSLADAFKGYYDNAGVFQTLAFEGIPAVLAALGTAGIRMHIATNKRWQPTQAILKHLGWDGVFHSVYTQDKAGGHKGKQAMLAQLLVAERIDSAGAVYIGDTPEDGVAANANGLPFIAVDWGYGNFYNRPDVVPRMHVASGAELLKALLAGAPPLMPSN